MGNEYSGVIRGVNNKVVVAIYDLLFVRVPFKVSVDRVVDNSVVPLIPKLTFAGKVQSVTSNSCVSKAIHVVSTILIFLSITTNINYILDVCRRLAKNIVL